MRDDLEHAADGIAVRAGLVDPGDHPRLGIGVGAAQRARVGLVARARRVCRIHGDAADLGRERPDLDAELGEERPRDGAGRDARGRLARRRSLQHVAHVVEAVLERAGEVGVPGPDPRDGRRALVALVGGRQQLGGGFVGQRLDLHHRRPVLPVAVADHEQDRRPQGQAVADTGHDLGTVLLDRLARPAAVAALPSRQVDRDLVGRQRQAPPGRLRG